VEYYDVAEIPEKINEKIFLLKNFNPTLLALFNF